MFLNMIRALVLIGVAFGTMGMSGCEEEGPAERMGERLDDAMSEAQDRLDDARDEVQEAAEEVGEALRGE
jgi:hyperosmotically inducible protein